jgi:alginate O-acetyltransferase complex protein AlgJ
MQNSKADRSLLQPTVSHRRYSVILVGCLLCASLYMMLQGMQGGLSQLDVNLPGRKPLIALFVRLRLRLGDHVFYGALVGKRGWLEYTGNGNSDSFQNLPRLSENDLKNIQTNLQLLYDKLRARNITLTVLIAPNKATIYPDRLPDEIRKINPQSDFDVLANYLQQRGPPVLVDVRPAMLAARQQRQIYYATETHWNPYGAYVAYSEIMKALSRTYPGLAPKDLTHFSLKPSQPAIHDIPRLMGATNILEPVYMFAPTQPGVTWITYNQDTLPMMVSHTNHAAPRSLLMYRDSFGSALIPFMAPQFREATFIVSSSSLRGLISLNEVDAVNPNVVVLELAERNIPSLTWLLLRFR